MTEHRLPVQQLIILSICRFAEPIALTSVFPYIPEMMESFGVPENDIARWAGIASAIFSICQASTALAWGAASDRYGRKPVILFGLFNTMCSMLLWGFSISLPMAIAARALQGLGNGNVGILRTTVAELCPWKELQPRAFSIMPLVYTLGAIFGPTLGGALANPLHVDPRKPRGDSFLERFPYALPNLAASSFFTIGIVVGWLYLRETLASKRHSPDLGLQTGRKLTAFVRGISRLDRGQKHLHSDEREPLLNNHHHKALNGSTSPSFHDSPPNTPEKSPRIIDVLTKQTVLNLLVYTLLATHTIGYDQLLPVFLHHPPQTTDSQPQNSSPPLKFAGGFGIDTQRIGVIFTLFSISSTLSQFLLFPPLARSFGVARCMRTSFLLFPLVYLVTPFIVLIPDNTARQIVMVAVLMVRGTLGTFAFPTSTIMLTNSAASLRVLGTINGIATSVSAVGRAVGPAIGGGLFTWGVKRGYVIVPFWALAGISLSAAVPTFWLIEGNGFGDDEEVEDIEEGANGEIDQDGQGSRRIIDASGDGAGAGIIDAQTAVSESEFGDFDHEHSNNFLTYTSTRSSAAIASEDSSDNDPDELGAEAADSLARRRSSNALSTARSHSQGRRRGIRPVITRQSSVPIGMGVGFRRLSSNLGSTGVGAPGTNWGGV